MNAHALTLLDALRGRLIVSCQPVPNGPMDRPETVAAMALAALQGGAAGLRIEGVANVRAVRQRAQAPLIGLIKRDLADSPVRITPLLHDVDALVDAGVPIVAVDATQRPRPVPVAQLIAHIRARGVLAMADCATLSDAEQAVLGGAQIVGSTMSGYTDDATPQEPDLPLIAQLRALANQSAKQARPVFVIAEGRYHQPGQVRAALQEGADAVVVGTAITRTEVVTQWFAKAMQTG